MDKRLTVAMAMSTAIHVASLAIVAHVLERGSAPPAARPDLVVSIARHESPSPVDVVERAVDAPIEEVAARTLARNTSLAALNIPEPIEPQPAPAPPPSPANDENPVVTVASTTAETDWSVSVPVTRNFSPGQERMLSRRVARWIDNFDEIGNSAETLTWTHDGQDYRASFAAAPVDPETGIPQVSVEISTVQDGEDVVSEIVLQRLALSNFAHFVNRWDADVQLHDDEMDGRFHSNSKIRLSYDARKNPVFHDRVTTSARSIELVRAGGPRRKDEIFLGGVETGVKRIRLPSALMPGLDDLAKDRSNVYRLHEDVRIVFKRDGSYDLHALRSSQPVRSGRLSDGTNYFLADRKVAVHIRGVVNGSVLVYSPNRIVIEGDILYAQDPAAVADVDDVLGLVSGRYVEVAPPEVTGPGDLNVHAAIHAQSRFVVRKLGSRDGGVLHLFGSLSAGSMSATEPRFATRIRYDRRLENLRPPGFPITDRIEIASWNPTWLQRSKE